LDSFLKANKPIPEEKRHITKRGNFIDDELKMKNQKVGPGLYPLKDEWVYCLSIDLFF
jgi:hypothetical protein